MKNSILSVLAVLFASIMLTGCGNNEVINEFAPKDTWIKDTITVDSAQFHLYFYYKTTDEALTGVSDTFNGKITKGLNVIVRASTGSSPTTLSAITGKTVAIKTFTESDGMEYGSKGKKIKLSESAWNVLAISKGYYGKIVSTPDCVTETGYTLATSFDSWKEITTKIIVGALIDKLLTYSTN